jgi:predicted transcriptional regulator
MNTAELKLELIRKIINVNDLETLLQIEEILKKVNNISNVINEPSAVYQKTEQVCVFNEWEQARINIALKQIENGEYISDEEAQIEIEKWFEAQEK